MAEDFKVLLGVELKPDALTDIQDDINKIQNKINPIQVRIDDRLISQDVADITQQINGIRQTNPIAIQLDRTSLQNVRNQIDGIRQQVQALGNIRIDFGGGNNPRGVGSTVTAMQRAFRQTSDLYKQIKNMEQRVGRLGASGLDADNITLYNQQLNALRNTYNNLVDALSGQNVNLDLVFNDINNARTAIETLSGVVDNARANLATDIKIKIDNGNLNDQIRTVEHSFDSLNITNDDVRNGITELRRLLGTMDASDNIEYVTAQYQTFKQTLIEVTNQVKELQRQQSVQTRQAQEQAQAQTRALRQQQQEQRQQKSTEILDASKNNLILSAEVWLKDHSAAARKFGSEISDLIVKIRACDNAGDLSILKKSLQDVQKRARLAGNDTKSLGDKLKKQFSEYSTYFSVASLMNYAEQAIRSMYNNVVELDSAMTDLMKVTDETADSYDRFLSNAGKNAQDLGRSVSSFVQQSANWAKMGFDTVESSELAKISSIYSNVADVDDATAVSDIVTAMKAFNIEANNAITIIDPMNKISNEFAVTAAGLGQGLSRAASTMATAGTDLEHTLALLTGISEITQSPEEAGNFLKTAIARIQGMKGTLEELGEEVDGSVDSISKVQTQILNLTHGEVNIFDDSGNFRDYYYIMQDIADVVDKLESTDRAQLYEILFGKNRMNQGAAMIQAFQSGRIGEALESALDSEGSAYAEQEKWMESLKAKIGQLEAAWESLSKTFISSNLLGNIIDWLTGLVNLLDSVVDKIGSINTIVAGIGIAKFVKQISSAFKTLQIAKSISPIKNILTLLSAAFPNAAKGINIFTSALSGGVKGAGLLKAAISGLWTVISAHPIIAAISAIGLLVFSFDKLHTSAKEANEKMEEAFSAYEDAKQNVIDTNKELENTKTKIDELQAKGGLTFVEQQELEDLREATKLLEIQADLAKEEEKRNAKKAAEAAVKAYEKNDVKTINDRIEDAEYSGNNALAADKKDVLSMIAFRTQMTKLRDKAQKLRDEAVLGSKEWDLYNYDVERYNKIIDDSNDTMSKQTDALWEQMSVLVGYKEKLEAISYEELTSSQKDLLDSINHTIDYVYKEFKPLKWKEMQLGEILDDQSISNVKKELVKLASENKAVGITIDDIKNKYPEFSKELEQALVDAGLSMQDFVNHINSEAGSINVDEYTRQAKEKLEESMSEVADSVSDTKVDTEIEVDVKAKEASLSEVNEWLDSFEGEDRIIACDVIFNYDTTGWSIDDFQNKFNEIKEPIKIPISFDKLMANEDFVGTIDNHIEKVNTLQEAYKSFKDGDFEALDFIELIKEFPELADNADDLDVAIAELLSTMTQDIVSKFNDQFGNMETDEDIESLQSFMDSVLELGKVVGDTQFSIDFEAETEGMDKFFSAIEESKSATGLTSESIKALKNRYKDLENYDAARLFEETTNGIRLNTDAVNDLEDAYQKQTKTKLDKTLSDLQKKYSSLTDEIKECDNAEKRAELYAQRDAITSQINDVSTLSAQYEGLTSAYYKWQQAQSAGNDRDMYEGIISGRKELEDEMSRGWLDDASVAYLEMLSGQDLSSSTKSIEDQIAAYKGLGKEINSAGYSVWDFFTYNDNGESTSEGVYNFFDTVRAQFGDTAAWVDKNGNYQFDFEAVGGDEVIAKALGISTELVQIMLRASEDAGFKINLDPTSTETEIDKTKKKIENLKSEPTNVKIEAEITEAEARLDYLIKRKIELEQPSFMKINVSEIDDTEIQNTLILLQEYQTAVNNLKELEIKGADTTEIEDAKTKVDELAASIQSLPDETKTKIGLQDDGTIESIKAQIANDEVKIPVKGEVTGTEEVNLLKEALDALKSKFVTATAAVFGTKFVNNLADAIRNLTSKTVTITTVHRDVYTSSSSESSSGGGINRNSAKMLAQVNGTAFVHGTIGKAFKQGDWGTKDSGVALGGELGQETVVRNGRFFTIGDNGAEFFNYKKGDIIFNHKQTEELFKNGKVTSGGGRGKALANGTAFVEGNAFADSSTHGSYGSNGSGVTKATISGSVKKKSSSSKSSSDDDESVEDEFKEKFDWIEIAIDRVERAISSLDLKANSVYKSWSSRNENLKKEISEIGNEITLQQSGYERYMKEANSVGLSEHWAKLVRDGTIDISTITDEDLADKIGEYQEW